MDIKKYIWLVFIIEDNINKTFGGICGTGLFKDRNTFITCYHVLSGDSFQNDREVRLVNIEGTTLKVLFEDLVCCPDKDMTCIKFKEDFDCLEVEEDITDDLRVRNYGFPISYSKKIVKLERDGGEIRINIKDVKRRCGKVIKKVKCEVTSPDVNIRNKNLFILNYGSEKGYSGGPLISCRNKIVGMMSLVVPKGEFKDKAMAISNEEF